MKTKEEIEVVKKAKADYKADQLKKSKKVITQKGLY